MLTNVRYVLYGKDLETNWKTDNCFLIIVTVFLNNIIIVHASQLDTSGSELNQSDITDTNQNESMSENNDLLPTEDSEFEEHVIEESNSKDLEAWIPETHNYGIRYFPISGVAISGVTPRSR